MINQSIQTKVKYLFSVSESAKFKGDCFNFRVNNPVGEANWQEMMRDAKPMTKKAFMDKVNINDYLDDGETWTDFEYMSKREHNTITYFQSPKYYFFKVGDYEFIWEK